MTNDEIVHTRDVLRELLERRADLTAPDHRARQAEFEMEIVVAAKVMHPGTRKMTNQRARALLGPARVADIFAPYKAAAQREDNKYKAAEHTLLEQIRATCELLTPEPGEHQVRYSYCSEGTYASTGSGAKYARAMMEIEAEMLPANLMPGVRLDDAHRRWECWIGVRDRELDLHIVRALKVDPVDLVRRCWAHGVNPRVYNPFLEHGFEAAHGLDFFGGQKK